MEYEINLFPIVLAAVAVIIILVIFFHYVPFSSGFRPRYRV